MSYSNLSRNPFKQVNYFNSSSFNNIYFIDVKELFRKPNTLKNKITIFIIKISSKGFNSLNRKPKKNN